MIRIRAASIWQILPLVGLVLAAGACTGATPGPAAARVCAETAAPASAGAARMDGGDLVLPLAGGKAVVQVSSLAVTGRLTGGGALAMSAPATARLGPPGPVTLAGGTASWSYPEHQLKVTVRSDRGRLVVTIRAARDGSLTWPVSGLDPAATAIQLPRGEGLSLPVDDPWWNTKGLEVAGSESALTGGLTMPFWGHTAGDRGVSYLVPDGIGTTLRLVSDDGRLHAEAEHAFSARGGTRTYTVSFALTGCSPVAAALDYRRWLAEHGQLGSLREKIAANPATGRLLGAFHAYLWGSARGADAVAELRRLEISRMWLGYATDEPMTAQAVAAAKEAGYLVSPYDSWDNAQDPRGADTRTSVWPGRMYPDACIRTKKGQILPGFQDRGCYLSSAALAASEPRHGYLAGRVDEMTRNGADSYFLDVDAAGEFFDDHSAEHPMTKAQDRDNRLARMRYVSAERRLVLGSETAGSWANTVLAYSHGSSTPAADQLWPLERDRERWGVWWPPAAPKHFFQPVRLPADLAKAMFDPAYRVPLYETVLHDSVISLDRWELSYYKLPDQQVDRALLAVLYNTPLNFVFGPGTLGEHGAEIAELQRFFAPLHQSAGAEPMTAFRWVTADHQVQQTRFGDGTLTVTANFGDQEYQGLPGGCADARLRGDSTPRRLCLPL
ncbi:glycoside hydrolase [Acrocarpospora sp. B8E8]|uniref:glycoside hydrolase n=1 Tax=Acrocarpospora sp. B8E8 TaxID=3153572 RepID=UPI00325D099E